MTSPGGTRALPTPMGRLRTDELDASDAAQREWDGFVLPLAGGNLMQSWGWGELKRDHGWEPVRIVARAAQGEVVGGIQVLFRRVARGVVMGYAPRGPAVGDIRDDADTAVALIAAARHEARRRRAFALKLDPEWPEDDAAVAVLRRRARIRDSVYEIQHRVTYVVDLVGGAEAVLGRLKSSTRRNIRLAERRGVQVDVVEEPQAAAARYYPLHLATADRLDFRDRVRPQSYFATLIGDLAQSCPCRVMVASVDGEDLSAMIALACGPRLIFLFGGNLLVKTDAKAAYLLHWRCIEWGIEQGCTLYDMWGVPSHADPTTANAGYFEFKTRWNGEVVRSRRCQDARLWPALGPLPGLAERAVFSRRPLPD